MAVPIFEPGPRGRARARPSAAQPSHQRLAPYERLNVDTEEVSVGAGSRYLGLLAATAGNLDQAADHFTNALAMNERMGARPWPAPTQVDYAKLLLARGGYGDSKRRSELLSQASATFRELGIEARRSELLALTATA